MLQHKSNQILLTSSSLTTQSWSKENGHYSKISGAKFRTKLTVEKEILFQASKGVLQTIENKNIKNYLKSNCPFKIKIQAGLTMKYAIHEVLKKDLKSTGFAVFTNPL